MVLDAVDRHNTTSEIGKFDQIAQEAADMVKNDEKLDPHFQFGWLDGNNLANSIVMGEMNIPSNL